MASKSPSLSISEVQKQLTSKKNLLGKVELSALPDGGAKLKQQIENLETLLQSLTLKKDAKKCSSNPSQSRYDEMGDRLPRIEKMEIIQKEQSCGDQADLMKGLSSSGVLANREEDQQNRTWIEKSSIDNLKDGSIREGKKKGFTEQSRKMGLIFCPKTVGSKLSECQGDDKLINRLPQLERMEIIQKEQSCGDLKADLTKVGLTSSGVLAKRVEDQQNHTCIEKNAVDNLKDEGIRKGKKKGLADQSRKMDQIICTKTVCPKLSECQDDGKLNSGKTAREIKSKHTILESSADILGEESRSNKELLSFSSLSKKIVPACSSTFKFPDSSSFKEYRQSATSGKGVKLIEALPLSTRELGIRLKGSSLQSIGTSSSRQQQKFVDVAASIHGTLKSCPPETDEELNPPELKTQLMKHQRRALAWLLWRETQMPSGGIFADDMGLGKTLTMISLVLKTMNEKETKQDDQLQGGTLIVCPASLIRQWNNEIDRHCDEQALEILMYQGAKRPKDANIIANYDAVICSYDILRSDGQGTKKGKVAPLLAIQWNRVILDEAHVIKNHKSVTSEWIYKVKSNHRWAVTGTPIHNDLADMYSLLKFLQCAPFDDSKVWKKLITDVSEHSVERRNALMKSILYRRCKDQVDENGDPLVKLPKKHIYTYKLDLSKSEMKLYETVLSRSRQKIINHEQKDRSSKGRVKLESRPNSPSALLVLLLRLQQCCNHPVLLGQSAMDDSVDNSVSDISNSLSSLSIDSVSSCSRSSEDSALDLTYDESLSNFPCTKPSSKIHKLLRKLTKILEESDGKDKSVIVSQWVSMLDIVAVHLDENGIEYHMIKGGMKPEMLIDVIEDFNFNSGGAPVILLSLKAGGVGLNLIGGNHLFLLDLHWNPALETQVCDRIYRVGQTKDIFIHKFMCSNTIEEKIVDFQSEKKRLASRVLNGAKNVRDHLSYEDIRTLFNL